MFSVFSVMLVFKHNFHLVFSFLFIKSFKRSKNLPLINENDLIEKKRIVVSVLHTLASITIIMNIAILK